MQIQLWVQALTRAEAEDRFDLLLACFEPTRGAFNRLVPHRPWRKRRFDRCFADQGWWPGASFVASLAEAHALTGRSLVELETFVGTQVWTRWGGRYGDVPPRPRPAPGPDRPRMIETPTKGWACIKPQDALKHVLVVRSHGRGQEHLLSTGGRARSSSRVMGCWSSIPRAIW